MKYFTYMIIFLSASLSAADENASKLSGSFGTSVSSQNLAGAGSVINEELLLENELVLRYGNEQSAWYGAIWYGMSLPEKPDSLNDEMDLTLGYERYWEHVALDASASYYIFDVNDKLNDDMWVADLKLKLHKAPVVQPYIHVRYFGKVGQESIDDGIFFFVGASRNQPLGFTLPWAEQEQTLSLGVKSAFTPGALGNDAAYVYTRLSVSTDIELSKRTYLTPEITWQISAESQNGGLGDYADGDELLLRLKFGVRF